MPAGRLVLQVLVMCAKVEPPPAPDEHAIAASVIMHWQKGNDELGLDACDRNAILRALAAGAFEAQEDCGHNHAQHAN